MPQVILPAMPASAAPCVQISVHVQAEVIGAEIARRHANVWLLENVGNLLKAVAPVLVLDDPLVWRVDVMLTSPTRGTIGWVGRLDVDATTGVVLADAASGEEIAARADAFAPG